MNIYWFFDRFLSLFFFIVLERNFRFGWNFVLWDLMYLVNWKLIFVYYICVLFIYISYYVENFFILIREKGERGREWKKESCMMLFNKFGYENGIIVFIIYLLRELEWLLECDFIKFYFFVWIINVFFWKLLIIMVGVCLGFLF